MTNVADPVGGQDEEHVPAAPPVFEPLEGERLEHMVTDRRGPLRWAASLMLSYQARQTPTPTSTETPAEDLVPEPVVAAPVPVVAAPAPEPVPAPPPPPPTAEELFAEDVVDFEEAEPVVVAATAPVRAPDLSGALAVRARLRGETVVRPVEDLEEEPAPTVERSKPEIVKFPSARQLRRLDRKAERAAAKEEKRLAESEAEAAPEPEPELVAVATTAPGAAEPALPSPPSGLTRSGRSPRRRAERPEARRPDPTRPVTVEPEPPALTNVPVWSATGDDEAAWNRWHTDPSSTDADDRWATLDEDLHRERPLALRMVERWGGRRHREDRSLFDED